MTFAYSPPRAPRRDLVTDICRALIFLGCAAGFGLMLRTALAVAALAWGV